MSDEEHKRLIVEGRDGPLKMLPTQSPKLVKMLGYRTKENKGYQVKLRLPSNCPSDGDLILGHPAGPNIIRGSLYVWF
jgi:hypothetical protein